MITYREAILGDVEKIARLHSLSWQQNYKGIWSDTFLNENVFENRLDVWQKRLTQPAENQYIFVAESDSDICGFACIYLNNDPVWDTLLDNLHVRKELKGQGIGTKLIKSVALYAYNHNPDDAFYLWVLEQNNPARKFYENLGATNYELINTDNPDGGTSPTCRHVWPDVKKLISEEAM